MVQSSYLSDQKHDLARPKHTTLNPQPAISRRKGTQKRYEAAMKSPALLSGKCFHEIRLYVDKKGSIKTQSSSTITSEEVRDVLEEAIPKYEKLLSRIKARAARPSFAIKADPASRSLHDRPHHPSKGDIPVSASDCTLAQSQSIKRPSKRRRSSSEDESACWQDDSKSHVTELSTSDETVEHQSNLVGIEIQDRDKLKEYLFDAFTSFQQINCRTLCKSWIRTIEPKKQVKHPYNGNLKVKGIPKFAANDVSPQKDSDPQETKPQWWPSKDECPHKEPDHIKKEQRLALLCHILMNTLDLHACSTEDLKEAIESDKAKIKPTGKEAILGDVWKIGHELERYKKGEIDGKTQVLVTARKEEARMIRGGGRARKPLDAREESEDEEYSEGPEAGPEGEKTPTPATPPALASSVQYQAARTSHIHSGEDAYMEGPPAPHFHPPETKDEYQDHQADYPMPVEVNPVLSDFPHQGSTGHVFNAEPFTENAYGNMQDIRSHAALFPPDEQQIIGQWAISAASDLYPMHYTGEPSQAPAINPQDGEHIFGHYDYGGPHKQPYRSNVHAYSVDSHGHYASGYEDDSARFQRINACNFPSQSTHRLHSAAMMHQHAYDLPTHIRA